MSGMKLVRSGTAARYAYVPDRQGEDCYLKAIACIVTGFALRLGTILKRSVAIQYASTIIGHSLTWD
jgi:hypothetical protein